jgi:hypothetical protein
VWRGDLVCSLALACNGRRVGAAYWGQAGVSSEGSDVDAVQYTLDRYSPSHTSRIVSAGELADVYASLDDSVLTWNDGGDDVLVVSVHDRFSTVSYAMKKRGTGWRLPRTRIRLRSCCAARRRGCRLGSSCLGQLGSMHCDQSRISPRCSTGSAGRNSNDLASGGRIFGRDETAVSCDDAVRAPRLRARLAVFCRVGDWGPSAACDRLCARAMRVRLPVAGQVPRWFRWCGGLVVGSSSDL